MDHATATAAIAAWDSTASGDVKKEVDAERKQRRAIRSKLTKSVNRLKDALADSVLDKAMVKNCKIKVQEAIQELEAKDAKIQTKMDDEKDSMVVDLALEADDFFGEPFMKSGIKAISQADTVLDSMAPASTTAATTAPSAPKVKLPKVDLPKFAGKSPAEYQTFWNSYESLIGERTDLSNVDKLLYLKDCCTEEAEKIAKGYTLTADNYEQLVNAFKNMYGIPRLMQQSHVGSCQLSTLSKLSI